MLPKDGSCLFQALGGARGEEGEVPSPRSAPSRLREQRLQSSQRTHKQQRLYIQICIILINSIYSYRVWRQNLGINNSRWGAVVITRCKLVMIEGRAKKGANYQPACFTAECSWSTAGQGAALEAAGLCPSSRSCWGCSPSPHPCLLQGGQKMQGSSTLSSGSTGHLQDTNTHTAFLERCSPAWVLGKPRLKP